MKIDHIFVLLSCCVNAFRRLVDHILVFYHPQDCIFLPPTDPAFIFAEAYLPTQSAERGDYRPYLPALGCHKWARIKVRALACTPCTFGFALLFRHCTVLSPL